MTKRTRREPLPYYKWLWQSWRSNRNVQRMSWQAKGLYRELLDEFWAEGVLPFQIDALADICGCPLQEFERFWPEIRPRFEETPAGYINRKMDEQRTADDSLRAARARAGASGAVAKLAAEEPEEQQVLASASKCQQMLASVSTPESSASTCHIEEKRREEKSREEKSREEELPVITIKRPEGFSPEMVAASVLMETSLHGQQLMRNLTEIVKPELAKGKDPMELRDALVKAHEEYSSAKAEGKFTQYSKRPENFYGDGDWKDPRLWPWRPGCAPKLKEQRPDPLAEIRREREQALREKERTDGSEPPQPAS